MYCVNGGDGKEDCNRSDSHAHLQSPRLQLRAIAQIAGETGKRPEALALTCRRSGTRTREPGRLMVSPLSDLALVMLCCALCCGAMWCAEVWCGVVWCVAARYCVVRCVEDVVVQPKANRG